MRSHLKEAVSDEYLMGSTRNVLDVKLESMIATSSHWSDQMNYPHNLYMTMEK